jgi:transposase
MPWRTESVMQQRVEFVIRARSGKKAMSELCREYGVSRPTGYLWLKRYEESGSLLGLQERSRRPHNSPGRTERALEELVLGLRDKTGWGALKLQEVLRTSRWNWDERPCIGSWYGRAELVRNEDR